MKPTVRPVLAPPEQCFVDYAGVAYRGDDVAVFAFYTCVASVLQQAGASPERFIDDEAARRAGHLLWAGMIAAFPNRPAFHVGQDFVFSPDDIRELADQAWLDVDPADHSAAALYDPTAPDVFGVMY